jgi:rhodanese-related sulfurtransferase
VTTIHAVYAFLANHWLLSSGLIVAIFSWGLLELLLPTIAKVSAQELVFLINREHALLLDLRDKAAFDAGHIPGAWDISPDKLLEHPKLQAIKRQRPVALIGGTQRQVWAMWQAAKQAKFTRVVQLAGGIAAWQEAGFTLTLAATKEQSHERSK